MANMATPKTSHGRPVGTTNPTPLNFPGAKQIASTAGQQPWLWLLAILTLNLFLVCVLVTMDLRYGIDYWNLVRDTNAIAGQPAYYGFYSNIGILLWALAACAALFGSLSLRRIGVQGRRLRALLWGGTFAAIACIDDLFMLHENAGWIGVPEKLVMAVYALFFLAFVASALPIIHRTKWVFLAGSIVSLALSTVVDQAHLAFSGSVLVEEGFKLTGIALFATYLVTLSFSILEEHCTLPRAGVS